MATALFMVKATIVPEREAAFNEWYNHQHVPDVFKYKGVVSGRRYKTITSEEKFQYLAVYEFESEETLREFLKSDHLKALRKDYDSNFGDVSERQAMTYVQVWP